MKRLVCVLASLTLAAPAHPQEPERHALHTFVSAPACASRPASLDEISELVDIEVRAQNVRTSGTGGRARLLVTIEDCEGRVATLSLESSDGSTSEVRTLDTSGIEPRTRPRVIALAIAEMLRRTRIFVPRPAVLPEPPPPPALPSIARPPQNRLLALEGQVRIFGRDTTALAGTQLELSIPLLSHAELGIRAGVALGGQSDPLGSVTLGLASVRLAPRLVTHPHPRLAFAAGPTFEIGAGWASGSSTSESVVASSGTASVVVIGLTGCLRAEVVSPFWLVSCMEGGGALAGLRTLASTRDAGGLRGITLGASVGAAIAF